MNLKPILLAATAAGCILLTGCAEENSPPAEATAATPTVMDDQLQVMDQARAVEGQLQVGKSRADAAIDEQSN